MFPISTDESNLRQPIDFEELYRDVKQAHVNKLSYPEAVMTSLYNKYSTIEEGIEISFE